MIQLVRGDITKLTNVDAIVNAANSSLQDRTGEADQSIPAAMQLYYSHGWTCLERRQP